MPADQRDARSNFANLYRLATMGYELVLAIVVMGAIGYGLDWAIGRTKPWLLVAGLFLGVIAGLARFMREARAAVRGSEGPPRPPGTGPS